MPRFKFELNALASKFVLCADWVVDDELGFAQSIVLPVENTRLPPPVEVFSQLDDAAGEDGFWPKT